MRWSDLVGGLAAAVAFAGCTAVDQNVRKVTSVVDPNRIDALQELASWKQQSESQARLAPQACRGKYASARLQVKSWIDGPLAMQIDDAAAQFYGAVDVSRDRIPPTVAASVKEFQDCAPLERDGAEDATKAANAILDWAKKQTQGQRKQSADALKARLQSLEWLDWAEARKGLAR